MGYTHVIISDCYIGIKLPDWFVEKYSDRYHIDGAFISSKGWAKYYDNSFFEDTQNALVEVGFPLQNYVILALSEDKRTNKVIITENAIKYYLLYGAGFKETTGLDYYGD